jgi:DNA repair exonuclease SbcCD ATPase subunit
MRIKSIHINNFLSFRDTTIELASSYDDVPTIYIINGLNLDSEDVDNSSNGAGKSVLIGESIMYNIYGRGLRAPKQRLKLNDMIRNGCDKMENLVEYFIQQDDGLSKLSISRSKLADGNSTTKIAINDDEISKRIKRLSDKDIKNFISLDADVFSQVIVYYHDNINLLSMNYGDRADFFKKIIDLTIIEDYYNIVREFKLDNDKKLYELEINQKSTKDIIEVISKDKNKYSDFIINRIKELKKELSTYDTKDDSSDNIEILEDKRDKYKIELDKFRDNYSEIISKINYETKIMLKYKDEIIKLSKLSGGTCPTCNQEVPVEYTDKVIYEYANRIEESNNKIKEYINTKSEYNNKIKEYEELYNNLTSEISNIKTELIVRKNKINSLTDQISKLESDLSKQKNTDDSAANIEKYEKKYIGLTNAIKIRGDWKTSAEYWYNMFAPKSLLRGAIIKKYITILSDMFEYYVSSLYNNEVIGKIIVDENNANNTQIDIILIKNSYEINYWQLSSGEKKRIDIAMMLALYEFTSYLNPNIPKYIILDEIFDSLDAIGRQTVMEVLLDVQNRHNIDLFMISHIQIPTEVIPEDVNIKYILVTKKDGISTAKILDESEEQ